MFPVLMWAKLMSISDRRSDGRILWERSKCGDGQVFLAIWPTTTLQRESDATLIEASDAASVLARRSKKGPVLMLDLTHLFRVLRSQ